MAAPVKGKDVAKTPFENPKLFLSVSVKASEADSKHFNSDKEVLEGLKDLLPEVLKRKLQGPPISLNPAQCWVYFNFKTIEAAQEAFRLLSGRKEVRNKKFTCSQEQFSKMFRPLRHSREGLGCWASFASSVSQGSPGRLRRSYPAFLKLHCINSTVPVDDFSSDTLTGFIEF